MNTVDIKSKDGEVLFTCEEREDGLFFNSSLDLRGTAITALPDNLTVGGSLDLRGTAITALPDNLTVGGYLYLRGTAITALPDNLTVGGYLYLRGTAITALPDNLTVGGSLDLEGTAITALPDNLTVGGSLDLRGTAITALPDNLNRPNPMIEWKSGRYILVDGIFTEVISRKKDVWKVKRIGRSDEGYVVHGNGKYAHGKTIQEAKNDLLYKISSRDKSKYEHLKLTDSLSHEEAIEAYRVITGACSAGTRHFVENELMEHKSEYTIAEIIEATKGKYGNDTFAEFFSR